MTSNNSHSAPAHDTVDISLKINKLPSYNDTENRQNLSQNITILKRIKNSTLKIWNFMFSQKNDVAVFIYKATYTTWLPFMLSFHNIVYV